MHVKGLHETPPWDWPQGTGKRLGDILRGRGADGADRPLAAKMAGDFTMIDDTIAWVREHVLDIHTDVWYQYCI